jgi:hypothetical protein
VKYEVRIIWWAGRVLNVIAMMGRVLNVIAMTCCMRDGTGVSWCIAWYCSLHILVMSLNCPHKGDRHTAHTWHGHSKMSFATVTSVH